MHEINVLEPPFSDDVFRGGKIAGRPLKGPCVLADAPHGSQTTQTSSDTSELRPLRTPHFHPRLARGVNQDPIEVTRKSASMHIDDLEPRGRSPLLQLLLVSQSDPSGRDIAARRSLEWEEDACPPGATPKIDDSSGARAAIRMLDSKFRTTLESGAPLLGAFVNIESPTTVEMLAVASMDFLMIDGEHGPIGLAEAVEMIRAAEARRADPSPGRREHPAGDGQRP